MRKSEISKKDLIKFSKNELIDCILILDNGSMWSSLQLLYEKRMENNYNKNKEIGNKVMILLDGIEDKSTLEEQYIIFKEIEKLNKIRDKNMKENDNIMKILYG